MQLGPAKSPTAMAGILQAIDTTILPRLVTFSVDEMSVAFNVGGRRLRACLSASDALKPPKGVVGEALSIDDPKPVQNLGKLLQKLLATEGELTMQRTDALSASDKSDAGIGADSLAEIWGVDLDAEPPSPLEHFIALLGGDLLASVEIDGEAVRNPTGDAAVIMLMEKAILPSLIDLEAQLTAVPDILVMDGMLAEDALVALVTLGDVRAMVATAANSYASVASAWSRI